MSGGMRIRFWDMDHTLLDNDCDVSWKLFLVQQGLAPRGDIDAMKRFWEDYAAGRLDPVSFNEFQLREFTGKTPDEMAPIAMEHFSRVIKPRLYPEALALVAEQKLHGDTTCLVTATNEVIARPVAEFAGFDEFISTALETADGRYTGKIDGIYCIGLGKIRHMEALCRRLGASMEDAYYYGDSVADIPVLHAAGHPVAVNPMPLLREHAVKNGWPIMEFSLDSQSAGMP